MPRTEAYRVLHAIAALSMARSGSGSLSDLMLESYDELFTRALLMISSRFGAGSFPLDST